MNYDDVTIKNNSKQQLFYNPLIQDNLDELVT